jgi:hypothetical protein
MIVRILLCLAAGSVCSSVASPQSALHTVNGRATVLPRVDGGLSLDFNESKLTATFLKSSPYTTQHPSGWSLVANLSGAAKKGRRDLFSDGNFNSEFAGDVTFAWRQESSVDAPISSYTTWFLTLGGALERQKFVDVDDAGAITDRGTETARAT